MSKKLPDSITFSRILLSFLLLAFPPRSCTFVLLYILCGATDVLDGLAARKLHAESERGAMLDSLADLIFAVIYAVRILPLMAIPLWIWIWTAVIAVAKVSGIILSGRKERRLYVRHTILNKLTGFLAFVLPLTVSFAEVQYGAALVCASATLATAEEMHSMKGYGENE